jgi:hypothetical protein
LTCRDQTWDGVPWRFLHENKNREALILKKKDAQDVRQAPEGVLRFQGKWQHSSQAVFLFSLLMYLFI